MGERRGPRGSGRRRGSTRKLSGKRTVRTREESRTLESDGGAVHRRGTRPAARRNLSGTKDRGVRQGESLALALSFSGTGEGMLDTTPLNALHRDAQARMVDFGGWDMPVHYGSQIEEHHAVRRDAGMFDVSHMRVVDLEGPGVRDFLRRALANDVAKLTLPGKALYSCMLNGRGGVTADLIAYFFREDWFRLVVNAGTADKDIAWLGALQAKVAPRVAIKPRRDLAIIAVQGPQAIAKLAAAFPATREPVA